MVLAVLKFLLPSASLTEVRTEAFSLCNSSLIEEKVINLLAKLYQFAVQPGFPSYVQGVVINNNEDGILYNSEDMYFFCRDLFNLGKIRTIQLEYTDAKKSIIQAAWKAPVAALRFWVQCNKWVVIVRLLLREIPERTILQKGMEKASRPCFELTNATNQGVRIGDLELFRSVAEKFSGTFASNRTHNLIVRLRHNLIRIGLRNISISYSRTSLPDVPKLRLDSLNPAADAESIISKAIRDGAIDA
ncbi:hypothetical protein RJ640_011211 [Escallonia rubra]|uniref:PCI domain-containing protein n=1 Tax=Escallonia rubra TaxID=112253 RepID=A0AA88RJW5_9ASTE|nr:hypothetical protein RJ640_011211 [Escallonia rubra]